MFSPEEKVRALFEEKRERRSEMIVYIQAQQNAILALIVFLTSAAGLYAKPELITNVVLGHVLLFALTQVIYFLSVYILSQSSILAGNAGYVAAIEAEINKTAGDKLTLYESGFAGDSQCPNLIRDPLALAVFLMGMMLLASWVFCLFAVLSRFSSRVLDSVVIFEFILLLWLAVNVLAAKKTAWRTAKRALSEKPEKALSGKPIEKQTRRIQ